MSQKSIPGKPSPLRSAVAKCPDSPAIISEKGSWTWFELQQEVDRYSNGLTRWGLETDDVVALHLRPSPETIAIIWACLDHGLIVAPLSHRWPSTRIEKGLIELSARILVVADQSRYAEKLPCPVASLSDLYQPGVPEGAPLPVESPHISTLLFTSGSSGDAKILAHDLENHLASARGANENIQLSESDSWLLSLPLDHVSGLSLLFRTVLSGAGLVLPGGNDLAASISRFHPSHVSLVATQMSALLEHPDDPLGQETFKAILLGGSRIPDELVSRAVEMELPLYTTYGSTEMASQVTTTPPGSSLDTLMSAGRLLPYRDLKISPSGEILLKGETLAKGSFVEGELQSITDDEGWFHSGDLGYTDAQELLHVTGRLDNQFISGGENIQPEEIEYHLEHLEGITGSLVIPVPDNRYGERPIAFLTLTDVSLDDATIRAQLKQVLPAYKIPDQFFRMPDDRNASGLKPSRKRLREIYHDRKNRLSTID